MKHKQSHLFIYFLISFGVLFFASSGYSENSNTNKDIPQETEEEPIIIVEEEDLEDDDDLIIEENATSQSTDEDNDTNQSYFDKHISGGFVTSYSGLISENTRFNNFLKIRLQDEWEQTGLSIALTGRAIYSESNVILKLKTTSKETKIKRTFKDKSLQWREAYLRWSKPTFDIYAGRRTLTLGQFEAFSPVDFVLPVDFSNNIVSFSKLSSKYPQTALSMILYPANQLELQMHYFPSIERDSLTKKAFESPNVFFTDSTLTGSVKTTEPFKFPKDQGQYLLRLLYTGNIIWGLTYHKGFYIFPETFTTLENDNFISRRKYRPITSYGFEIAIPFGKYTAKYEILSSQSLFEGEQCFTDSVTCTTWKEYIKNQLNGNSYFEYDGYFQALGYDYKSDDWTVNFAIIHIFENLTDEQQKAKNMSKTIFKPDSDISAIPLFHFAKHYGADKSHTSGLGFGFLGAAAGLSVYHGYKYSEALTLGTSFDYLMYRNQQAFLDKEENESETNSEVVSTTNTPEESESKAVTTINAPVIRFTLIYDF